MINLNRKVPIIVAAIVIFLVGLLFSFFIILRYKEILEIRYGAPYYFDYLN
ncbi:MAG: hypothetical protein PHH17_01810 [Candidatus Pacebacteria bacterium]|nr:hypothetical protein [Candidatus Paceibacterota bacterium]MDD3729092.1 hypothetical protein [Candidatus Paceibacterota bacterium]MDD4201607.1 hypothetical protein [Candidatus Paceibacterota bacterium]MDD4467097.1 hypothetical protein [Candidatus Paceibacterota bacterium]MDD4897619.1 hypothetical protein [Candidatus Paceibacterota bacterium]